MEKRLTNFRQSTLSARFIFRAGSFALRYPRSLAVIRIALLTAWLALAVAAPAPVAAQQQISLTPSNPRPIVCKDRDGNLRSDGISVTAHPSFNEAPFNQLDRREYELHLYSCASDVKTCFTPDRKPIWPNWNLRIQQCDNGNCGKWPVTLNRPRAVTVYLASFLHQKGGKRLTGGKLLQVNWTNTEQRCPEQQNTGPAVAEDIRAQFAWAQSPPGGFTLNVNGRGSPPDNPANLTGNVQNWNFTGHDSRTGAHVKCSGGLDPGKRAAPEAPGTIECTARMEKTVWKCKGNANMQVSWSIVPDGYAWFAILPGRCVGTITEDGKPPVAHNFGVIWVRGGLPVK